MEGVSGVEFFFIFGCGWLSDSYGVVVWGGEYLIWMGMGVCWDGVIGWFIDVVESLLVYVVIEGVGYKYCYFVRVVDFV